MIATSPADILRFVLSRAEEGVDTVLVTLTGIERTSSRGIGSQMAVAADGRYAGSFSGGCIEAAVVSEALDALAGVQSRFVRFGVDSKYIDIRLPCGGGVDLLFNPRPDPVAIADAIERLDAREPAALRVTHAGIEAIDADRERPSGWSGDAFDVHYAPDLRIVAIGQGEDLAAMARLAHRYGAEVTALTPDQAVVQSLAGEGI